jgi:hypothetical protein
MVTARLLTNYSSTLRDIHTNARENITRTRAKRKAGYFFEAHSVFPYLYRRLGRCGESRHLLVVLSFLVLVDGHFFDSERHFNELYYYYYY